MNNRRSGSTTRDRRALALGVALVACAPSATPIVDSGITTADDTTGHETPSPNGVTTVLPSATSSGTSGSVTTGATPVTDVGADDWDLPDACGALDLVFVVERSNTTTVRMYNDIKQLVLDVAASLPDWSIHYLFVEGRVGTIPIFCEGACEQTGECEEAWDDVACDQLEECDWYRGAGLRWDSADDRCLTKEPRWLDGGDPNLVDEARCLWKTNSGAGEIDTIASLLASVSPAHTIPGGCNSGFLRENAFLVPVIVSHGYPNASGSPITWADELVDAKGGADDTIVPVAILDPDTQPWNPPGCEEGPGDQTGEYAAFVELFDGAVIGSICTNYQNPVLAAVEHIAGRCAAIPD